jgi:hypothetical protein
MDTTMLNTPHEFYVSITTIKKYKVALDMLLESLPWEWKSKYILVYQDEDIETHKTFEDGHIEVYIKNNLSDYGNWVGVSRLVSANVISQNAWFLFIHDTCKFLEGSAELTNSIIEQNAGSDVDILWLCNTGQCNICLIRKNAIYYGNSLYENIKLMSKMDTIEYEWNHKHKLSPKSFPLIQKYVENTATHLGRRYVYSPENHRDVLLYHSINMEKYFYYTKKESDHPLSP